ncbi:MAG: hypothetical protein QNK05_17935 [Myxococcota bacterium]|nr:hypothetical protein [Myxococcota bacterium]
MLPLRSLLAPVSPTPGFRSFAAAAVLALLVLAPSPPVHAALDQSAISNVSGFIGAYAGLQNGSNPDAGGDLETAYLASDFLFDEVVFATGGGSASASQSYSGALGTNSASGMAQAGTVRFQAQNVASNQGFAGSMVHAGWNDAITLSHPTLNGIDGVWLFDIDVSGSFAATGFAGSARVELSAYKDNLQLRKNQGPFDPGASDPISTDRQQAQWGISSAPNGSRSVSDTVTFAVPFTFGEAFTLGVYSFASAGKRSSSAVPGTSTANADFLSTVSWGGTNDVLVSGSPVGGFSIGAASGIDWLAAVPEPHIPSGLLLLALVGACALRPLSSAAPQR